jgi:glycosyltransferase involved in cell wall biosynthesis
MRAAAALPAAVARLARAIRSCRSDVVVTNSAKAHVYGSLAGRLARRPVVWRMHDTMDSADFAGSTRRLLLAVGRRIPARILTVTDATGRVLVAGGVPAGRVTTLYNGIDLAALRADAARAARRDGAPRVGSVGRITPLKGHAVVIEAAARLQERGVDARFVIAGAPSHEAPGHLEELRERAERLGVGERVELISPFPDLAEVLSGLDVMVSASVLPDSLPTTVIASMALGVPVVASELGGGPELVRDDETGIVVPPNDAGRIADAVAALIAAPERRAAYGRAASEDASARFDVDDFADAFAGHLEAAAAGRREDAWPLDERSISSTSRRLWHCFFHERTARSCCAPDFFRDRLRWRCPGGHLERARSARRPAQAVEGHLHDQRDRCSGGRGRA